MAVSVLTVERGERTIDELASEVKMTVRNISDVPGAEVRAGPRCSGRRVDE